ncbi:MAG: GtrA family protein [Streptosporangiales bacterium]|nr:GtrA family protein [Streptosporangiales bacterium]MBO0890272.1 GtrA family protein [Acidothermales bacterium]
MGIQARAQQPPHVARRSLLIRFTKYTAGSVVATVCSEVTFLLVYGVFHGGSVVASVLGWLAGVIPNYFLNRSWAWGRKGRHDLRREVLPYAAIALVTVGLASLTTHVAGVLVPRLISTHWLQVGVVGAVFLATYGVLFAARFVLLDRLFGLPRSRHQVDTTTRA